MKDFTEYTEEDIQATEDLQEIIDVLSYQLRTQPSPDILWARHVNSVIDMAEREKNNRARDDFYKRKAAKAEEGA